MTHNKRLTPKQERWAREYVIDLNATRAARAAGYSEKGAGKQAHDLKQNPVVMAYVRQLQAELELRSTADAEMVIRELARMSLYNLKDYLRPDGTFKPVSELTRDQAAAVTSVRLADDGRTVLDLKLADKRQCAVDLGKHFGIFQADNEQQRPVLAEETPTQKARLIAYALHKAKRAAADGATPTDPETAH